MNTSLSWIKAYVPDLDVTAQEYTDAMTLSGTKVEGFEVLDADLEKIVIGQIDKIEKHPDADKLVVCQVNVGTETVQIVTGAKNVFEGAKVPVVLDGGRVAGSHDGKVVEGGIKIKKGKLRGVESFGMMCSIEELGSTTDLKLKTKYKSSDLLKFIIPSLLGVILFMVPINDGGNITIPVAFFTTRLKDLIGDYLPTLSMIVVVIAASLTIITKAFKPKFIIENDFLNSY